MKRKTMGVWFHALPSLEQLDRLNFLAIGIGFWLLSIGVVCGFLGSRMVAGRWWVGDPKVVMTMGLWASYLALWLVRVRATLRGRRVALISMLGFSLVLFTSIGAAWLVPTFHPYLYQHAKRIAP